MTFVLQLQSTEGSASDDEQLRAQSVLTQGLCLSTLSIWFC